MEGKHSLTPSKLYLVKKQRQVTSRGVGTLTERKKGRKGRGTRAGRSSKVTGNFKAGKLLGVWDLTLRKGLRRTG